MSLHQNLSKVMQKELSIILEKFPEFRRKILELFEKNEDFKSLCEDYWKCKKVISKTREHLLEDTQMENQYVQMSADLEQDVLRFLKMHH